MSDPGGTRAATVLIPTHDHGQLLALSVAGVQRQTMDDFELFIVGDGASDETRAVAHQLADSDERIRFFDFPKGERHGEAHRHVALADARGRVVLYCADDDLWLPDHIAAMSDVLGDAEFACTQTIYVWPDGTFYLVPVDLARPRQRALHCAEPERANRVPLAAGGHTLAAYRALPGWSPAPPGMWTDLHFFRQFLWSGGCRAASTTAPTLLKFHSPQRTGMTPDQRLAELQQWTSRIEDPAWMASFPTRLLGPGRDAALQLEDAQAWKASRADEREAATATRLEAARSECVRLAREHAELQVEVDESRAEREMLRTELTAREERLDAAERQLRDIRSTRTWRARNVMVRLTGRHRRRDCAE